MSKLVWDQAGEKLYESGVRNGVLYVQDNTGTYPKGVVWNGLTSVNETPSGAESNPSFADDIKYLNLQSAEDFGVTIEAYTYPDEFAICDGSAEVADGVMIGQQSRKSFGFCYRTTIGNDVNGVDHGYKLHLVYGCLASPSERSYQTINDSPEAITFSWEVKTTPVPVTGFKPTACLTVNSTKTPVDKMKKLEEILYGKDAGEGGTPTAVAARLPDPNEVIALIGTTQG